MTNKNTVLRLAHSTSYDRQDRYTPLEERDVSEFIRTKRPIPDSDGGWINPRQVIWWWDKKAYDRMLAERTKRWEEADLAQREDEVRRGIRETVDGPQIGSPAWNKAHPFKKWWQR